MDMRYFCYVTEDGKVLRDTKASDEHNCFLLYLKIYQPYDYEQMTGEGPHITYVYDYYEPDIRMRDLALKYLGICNGRILPFTGVDNSTVDNNYLKECKSS